MEVCHSCDRTLCFQPGHLFVGTHKVNMADAAAKGRIKNATDYGKRMGPKLKPADVIAIRARRAAGESGVKIAATYGLHYSQVYRISNRKAWREI